ncbi:MAG TPA: gluconolaconase, partial [Rhodobiaceae bacterium]|nr:gluconolaconase [Rhodobiaceae bacterium]
TIPGRLWAFDVTAPGELAPNPGPLPGRFVGSGPQLCFFDSLAVDSEGNICVATIFNPGITVFSPDGSKITHTPTDDFMTTNICFGGKDLKTAYITLSSSGRLVSTEWPVAGLPLNFLNK